MACYHPVPALQAAPGEKPVFYPPLGTENLRLPCGTCVGCRTDRATEWATRCVHEAGLSDYNCFVTLTYSDAKLPPYGFLRPQDLTKFFKRLRRYADRNGSAIDRVSSRPIRYFACGEYGDRSDRPHYHTLLFNCRFNDLEQVGKGLYRSAQLGKLWKFGEHWIGENMTGGAAGYIAQYSMKKQRRGFEDMVVDEDGVVLATKQQPFLRMSCKPPIGAAWVDEYQRDLSHGYVENGGRLSKVPRTYRNRIKKSDPQLAEDIDFRSWIHATRHLSDKQLPERLLAAEVIHIRRKALLESRHF